MNAHPQIKTDSRDLHAALADRLEKELMIDVFNNPEAEAEETGNILRRGRAKYEQRRADTRKGLKEVLASLTADEAAIKEQFAADMADIAQRKARAREQARIDIEFDTKLIATSKAALSVLDGK